MSILLGSTSDIVRIVTDTAATIDVHASWVDLAVSTTSATPGRLNTAIAAATTTTVIASPASGSVRKMKGLRIRNRHASLSCTVTIQHYDGSVSVEIDKRALGPGASIYIDESGAVLPLPTGGKPTPSWQTQIIGAYGDCDPSELMRQVQRASTIAATPTAITASVARCCSFMPPADITINRIRFFGVGATTSVFRVAIYRMSDLARLTAELAFSTAAATWGTAGSALNLALSANTVYFMACTVNTTGTTAGPVCFGTTVAATTGQIAIAPQSLPGSLANTSNYLTGYQFQFAVSTGVLPATAPTLAAQAAWTGGMPAFWLDTVDS